jgi:purine-binding chemotaxis protein CheW
VDEIGDVVEVNESLFETVPETLSGSARDLLEGVYKLDGRLLLILDTERTANLPASYNRAADLQFAG